LDINLYSEEDLFFACVWMSPALVLLVVVLFKYSKFEEVGTLEFSLTVCAYLEVDDITWPN
jgi:hypothetical protein